MIFTCGNEGCPFLRKRTTIRYKVLTNCGAFLKEGGTILNCETVCITKKPKWWEQNERQIEQHVEMS